MSFNVIAFKISSRQRDIKKEKERQLERGKSKYKNKEKIDRRRRKRRKGYEKDAKLTCYILYLVFFKQFFF